MLKTKQLYQAVSKRVDTQGTKINAAETSRVVSETFSEIADQIDRGQITELEAVVWFTKELEKKIVASRED